MGLKNMIDELVKSTERHVKKSVLTAATIGSLLMPVQARTEEAQPQQVVALGDIELMAAHRDSTLDTKIRINLTDTLNIVDRNRLTIDYSGKATVFHYATLNAKITDGLTIGGGIRGVPSKSIDPQISPHYAFKHKGFSLLQIISTTVQRDSLGLSLTRAQYAHKLNDRISIIGYCEAVTMFNYWSNVLSTQRLRIGIGYKNLQFGAAVDLFETGPKGDFSFNAGAYFRVGFKAETMR